MLAIYDGLAFENIPSLSRGHKERDRQARSRLNQGSRVRYPGRSDNGLASFFSCNAPGDLTVNRDPGVGETVVGLYLGHASSLSMFIEIKKCRP